ncbi:MAG: patatin-like phospholipase family protein [Candidatus Omnitrophota bacterium]
MNKRFQVLTLDGGGIKGLFSAAFLSKLEEDLNTKIVDHFDLIVGTSTGGIIALGLGLGLSPQKLVEFYFNKGPEIFNKFPLWTSIKNLFSSKYSGDVLEKIFQEKDCFGSRRLGESNKRLVIPSYNIDTNDVYVFKTAHHIS